MSRRPILMVILTLGLLATPLAAEAQQPGKVYRVGVLSLGQGWPARVEAAFLEGLRERGWVEGQSNTVGRRHDASRFDLRIAFDGPTHIRVWLRMDLFWRAEPELCCDISLAPEAAHALLA